MTEDQKPPKKTTVDLACSFDRIYWRHRFQTTDALLAEAVDQVGTNPLAIGAYIENHKAITLRGERPILTQLHSAPQ
jgi:hypothetical protein